jgi:hypothetical protein
MNTLTDCLEAPCEFAARERKERIEADIRHETSLEQIKGMLSNQTRTLGLIVAGVTVGMQIVERFFK